MTSRRRALVSPGFMVALVTASLAFWAACLFADGGGRTGVSTSANGCSCHGSSPNANGAVSASLTGPQTVLAGSLSNYTISVAGAPSGAAGGFNLKADGGTFTAGTGNKVSNGELTHSNNSSRSWSFKWTAPAIAGTYRFWAVGMTSNGSGTGGDSWNWYGGTVSTPFTITVGAPIGDTAAPAAVTDLR